VDIVVPVKLTFTINPNNTNYLAMAVCLSPIAPRFILPKISSRVTAVRPAQVATLSTCSLVNRQRRRSDSTSSGWTQESHPSRISITQCLILKPIPRSLPLASRKAFSSTPHLSRNHHFDTLKFVQKLKDEGFTEDQAVALMKVLNDVIEERSASQFLALSGPILTKGQHSKPHPNNGPS
jgi:hypothetical protein